MGAQEGRNGVLVLSTCGPLQRGVPDMLRRVHLIHEIQREGGRRGRGVTLRWKDMLDESLNHQMTTVLDPR